jgi:hypothetical protein
MPAQFILTPKTTADFSNNVRAARAHVGGNLGLSMPNGSPEEYRALNQADQIRVADETSAFIVSQPTFFTPLQVELAQKRVSSTVFRQPLADTSLTAAAGDFFTDLAGRYESKVTGLIVVAIVAALAFTLLPAAIARAKAGS